MKDFDFDYMAKTAKAVIITVIIAGAVVLFGAAVAIAILLLK